MRHERRSARSQRLLLAFMLIVATVIAPLTRATEAHALPGASPGALRVGPALEEGTPGPGGDTDRWWGVAGAALCGLEIRLIIRVPAVGMNPYALAAGIAGCSLAMLDVFTTH